MATTTAQVRSGQLYTGDEYLESLRDGREVYLDGERVEDVTTHPAFRNSARIDRPPLRRAARPGSSATRCVGEDRHGIVTHQFFKPSYSVAGPVAGARGDRRLVARCPTASWAARPTTRPRSWRRLGAEPGLLRAVRRQRARTGTSATPRRALFLNHVLINPPIDRKKAGARGRRRLRPRRRGDRRRHHRQRREDAGDRLGADARHVRRAEQRGGAGEGQGRGLRARASSRRWTRPA